MSFFFALKGDSKNKGKLVAILIDGRSITVESKMEQRSNKSIILQIKQRIIRTIEKSKINSLIVNQKYGRYVYYMYERHITGKIQNSLSLKI